MEKECNCKNIIPGSYDNQVELERPSHMIGQKEGSESDTICIDSCISEEIQHLWSLGISTTGCCCGHNDNRVFPYIGVIDKDIPKMKKLGYYVQINPLRPKDEDSFIPKLFTPIEVKCLECEWSGLNDELNWNNRIDTSFCPMCKSDKLEDY